MAAGATRSGSSGIFWMNDVSDEDQPLSFVPGVDGELNSQTPFNLGTGSTSILTKRGTRMRGAARQSSDCKTEAMLKKGGKKQGQLQSDRSGAYTKEKVSVHHSAAVAPECTPSLASDTFLPPSQVISEASRARSQICLKDLCPEDKRRIANLIEELARVSEEKEESVQRLKDEQESFERKIQQLEQQNLIIAQERESLQQQYRECQELLGLYQQYLSQQQAKLNESIAQLSQVPAHSKVLSSEAAHSRTSTSRANGSLFDGSYLSLAATRARQPQVHRSGDGGAVQTWSNPASLSHVGEFSPNDGPIKQHRIHKRECRDPHSESCHRCENCQGSGQDSGYGTQQRRNNTSCRLENGHHDTLNQHECERLQSGTMGSEAKEALTRPLLGHEDWEEKRHQLLLQKMQLEMERERLQARLDEQEERLNRQNQQLRQSRLEYSRFQQTTQTETSSSNTRDGDPQLEGPSHQDLPSSVRGDAELHPAEQNLHEKGSQPAPAPLDNGVQTREALEQSRRDIATSPAKSPASLLSKPTSASVIPKTPEARLDFSVVELLDIFSPVSAPEQSKLSTRKTKTTQRRLALATPKPVGRTLLTPARFYPQSTQQDLEESQILEDIFFIC
ncbi:protein hinderin isoform X1 [Lates calcarifer]|uniref:Protein hinderin isoform X1 n=1 Tax=Lates calcarifer TaxID=8187 RepID=A0A4W6CSK4_LATCA|nr:protein hinderin isoform X1 [Lates calcarifer]